MLNELTVASRLLAVFLTQKTEVNILSETDGGEKADDLVRYLVCSGTSTIVTVSGGFSETERDN